MTSVVKFSEIAEVIIQSLTLREIWPAPEKHSLRYFVNKAQSLGDYKDYAVKAILL